MEEDEPLSELEKTQAHELAIAAHWLRDHPNQALVDALLDALTACHALGRKGAALRRRKLDGTRTTNECIEAMRIAEQAVVEVKRVHQLLRLLSDGNVCLHSSAIH